jgi:tight adherence protein B
VKEKGLMNYDEHKMTLGEIIKYGLLGMSVTFALSILFYGNIMISIFVAAVGLVFIPYKKKQIIIKQKKELREQFKEGIYSLSASIKVGKSIESAFVESLIDLQIIYQNNNCYIIREFEYIARKIAMNETIENALLDFSKRAKDEDITNFANVFITAKRSGGNLVEIMQYTSNIINEKIEIVNNIDVLITQKKYEQIVMAFMLPFMIVYFRFCMPDFLDVMYNTIIGRIAMTFSLGLYGISFYLGKKIVSIEV